MKFSLTVENRTNRTGSLTIAIPDPADDLFLSDKLEQRVSQSLTVFDMQPITEQHDAIYLFIYLFIEGL